MDQLPTTTAQVFEKLLRNKNKFDLKDKNKKGCL
jgi:hypothetical protein